MSDTNKPGNNTSRKIPAGHGAGSDGDENPVVTKRSRSSTSRGSNHGGTLATIPEQPEDVQKPEKEQPSIGKATQQETKESSPPKITKDRVDVTLKRMDEVVKAYDKEVNKLKEQIQELNGQIQELKDKINQLATNAKGLRVKQRKWEERKPDLDTIAFIFKTQKRNRSPTDREQRMIEKGYGSIEKDLNDVANELGHAFRAQYQ